MMNKIVTGIVIVASALLTACGGSDSPETDKSIIPPVDSNKALVAPASTDGSMAPQTITTAPTTNPQVISSPQQAVPATTAAAAAGLNPAHGQPGHRCDISVGAPLNSAPTATTQPQVQTTAPAPAPTMTAPSAITAPANPNAKLNPAHGQPGHDCAVAVGAPLKG